MESKTTTATEIRRQSKEAIRQSFLNCLPQRIRQRQLSKHTLGEGLQLWHDSQAIAWLNPQPTPKSAKGRTYCREEVKRDISALFAEITQAVKRNTVNTDKLPSIRQLIQYGLIGCQCGNNLAEIDNKTVCCQACGKITPKQWLKVGIKDYLAPKVRIITNSDRRNIEKEIQAEAVKTGEEKRLNSKEKTALYRLAYFPKKSERKLIKTLDMPIKERQKVIFSMITENPSKKYSDRQNGKNPADVWGNGE